MKNLIHLTPQQRKALAAYNFSEREEDRYIGSVSATVNVQRSTKIVDGLEWQHPQTHQLSQLRQ